MKEMDMDEFVDMLLKALDKKKVQAKVKEILNVDEKEKKRVGIFGGNDEKWKESLSALKAELEKEKREKDTLSELVEQLEQKRNILLEQRKKDAERIECLQLENQRWEERIEQLEIQMEKLESGKTEIIKEKEKLEQEKSKVVTECEKIVSESNDRAIKAEEVSRYYERAYIQLEQHFRLYVDLGDEVHQDLSRVLSAESPELFLGWGTQKGNIEALWDFISYKLDSYQPRQIESLNKIFDYLFEIYERIEGDYKRLDVSVGEEFDEEYHTRGSHSAVSGNISEVLLRGYQKLSSQRRKKSIVRI